MPIATLKNDQQCQEPRNFHIEVVLSIGSAKKFT